MFLYKSVDNNKYFLCFTIQPLQVSAGIVFTSGVQLNRWIICWPENSCLGCISQTVKYRKFILGGDIGWGL